MKHSTSALLGLMLTASFAIPCWAFNLTVGQPLPEVSLERSGELVLKQDEVDYQPWRSEQLKGKVRLLQIMAGRSGAKTINAPMIDAIKAAKLDPNQYQTVTLINLDDAVWGTSKIVRGKVEKNKKEFPYAGFIVDDDGKLFEQWQVAEKTSAIVLLDKQGTIRFAKQGALTQAEIDTVLKTIQNIL